LKSYFSALYGAIPDLTMPILDLISEGDTVMVRNLVRGTHQGDFGQLKATGKDVRYRRLPYKYGWIGDAGLAVVAVILLGLLAILFVYGLFHLPSFWREQNKAAEESAI
jgi:hypothetical protein